MVKIPFSFVPVKVLKGLSTHFIKFGTILEKFTPYIQQDLNKANLKIESKKYLAMCFTSTLMLFVFLALTFTLFLSKTGKMFAGVFFAFLAAFLILFIQINYPKLQAGRRTKKLDTDLLGALRAMLRITCCICSESTIMIGRLSSYSSTIDTPCCSACLLTRKRTL